jgi:D-alanyl-lipoteichoic acid acyltransferase DltB (MBOAT superfamily)
MRELMVFGAAVFFIFFGTVEAFWPATARRWSRIDAASKPKLWPNLMQSPAYNLSFRAFGVLMILIGIALVWVYFHPN